MNLHLRILFAGALAFAVFFAVLPGTAAGYFAWGCWNLAIGLALGHLMTKAKP